MVEAQSGVEILQGRVEISLSRVENPAVVVRLRVLGSDFDGCIEILQSTLPVALDKISFGAIQKRINALVALHSIAVQELGACLNDHGRRALPVAIDALVDYNARVPRELHLTDPYAQPVQLSWIRCILCRIAFCEFIRRKLWQRRLVARLLAGDCD